MRLFTFRVGARNNWGSLFKSGLSQDAYTIEWADCLPGTEVLSSITTTAINSVGAVATTNCVNSSTISGTTSVIALKTCGAGGTGAANDNDRFEIKSQATLVSGKVFEYLVLIYVRNKTYAPTPV